MKNKAILFLIDQKFAKIPVRKSNKTKKNTFGGIYYKI